MCAQVTRVPAGTRLFRGVGENRELPESFGQPDRGGFMELGFLSTSASREVAAKFSKPASCGIKDGKPLATVFEIETDAVNCGALVADFSQYPRELPPPSSLPLLPSPAQKNPRDRCFKITILLAKAVLNNVSSVNI